MIYFNPYVFFVSLDENYYLLINPQKRNSLYVITLQQYKLLTLLKNSVSSTEDMDDIVEPNVLDKFYLLFKRRGVLSDVNNFPADLNSKPTTLNLWMHSTDRCNLRCKYCYIETKETNEEMSPNMISNICKSIITTVKEESLKLVSIRFGGGEPFLSYKKWDYKLTTLKKSLKMMDCELRIVFLTNLTVLNNDILSFIERHKVFISVSLDGIGKYNDSSRIFINGEGTYNVIIKNLYKLLDKKIKPSIMNVVTNNNLDGLTGITMFAIEHNLSIRFSIVQHQEFNYEKAYVIFLKCYKLFEDAISKGYKFSKKHKLCDLNLFNFSDKACGSGVNNAAIYIDGAVYFCQQQVGSVNRLSTIKENENIFKAIRIGKVSWNGVAANCGDCQYINICAGGCPLSIDKYGKSPSCIFFQKIIPIIYSLIGKERLMRIK